MIDVSRYFAINGSKSETLPVTSGVLQVSHLGPLIFNKFLNDISNCFNNTNIALYSDDLKKIKI